MLGAMKGLPDSLVVVLHRPQLPQNIGAAARAMANMGLSRLRLVAPQDLSPEPMRALATGAGTELLEAMEVFGSLPEALADCAAAAATTARKGRFRGRLVAPRQAAPEILAWAASGPAALVFGPEDRGLTAAELDHFSLTISIPTSDSASLNLAQAVMVVCYELRLAALAAQGRRPAPLRPRPASLAQQQALYEHLFQGLLAIGVLPADNPRHFLRKLKGPLMRGGITAAEVRAWRGLARRSLWVAGRLKELQGPGKKK